MYDHQERGLVYGHCFEGFLAVLSENCIVAKPKSDLMMGGADILAAGIAYFVTNWKVYLSSVGSIGVFAIIAGLITVQKANVAPAKPVQQKSLIKEVSSVAKSFFTSGEIIKTTLCAVSFDETKLQLMQNLGNNTHHCLDVSIWTFYQCW